MAIWLLMAIPSKKGLAAQFHWFKGSTLVNINGGHSEGYIRNASLGSVSKIANLSIFHSLILIHLDNHIFQGSLHQSLQVGMFYIIDCFSGLGVNIGSLIARVAYGFSYSHWNTVGVTAGPSQWQNRVGAY